MRCELKKPHLCCTLLCDGKRQGTVTAVTLVGGAPPASPEQQPLGLQMGKEGPPRVTHACVTGGKSDRRVGTALPLIATLPCHQGPHPWFSGTVTRLSNKSNLNPGKTQVFVFCSLFYGVTHHMCLK